MAAEPKTTTRTRYPPTFTEFGRPVQNLFKAGFPSSYRLAVRFNASTTNFARFSSKLNVEKTTASASSTSTTASPITTTFKPIFSFGTSAGSITYLDIGGTFAPDLHKVEVSIHNLLTPGLDVFLSESMRSGSQSKAKVQYQHPVGSVSAAIKYGSNRSLVEVVGVAAVNHEFCVGTRAAFLLADGVKQESRVESATGIVNYVTPYYDVTAGLTATWGKSGINPRAIVQALYKISSLVNLATEIDIDLSRQFTDGVSLALVGVWRYSNDVTLRGRCNTRGGAGVAFTRRLSNFATLTAATEFNATVSGSVPRYGVELAFSP